MDQFPELIVDDDDEIVATKLPLPLLLLFSNTSSIQVCDWSSTMVVSDDSADDSVDGP